jgi:regulator of sigma E protease
VWAVGLPTLGEPTIGGVENGSLAEAAGLMAGDRIVSIDGEDVDDWADIMRLTAAADGGAVEFTVERETGDRLVSAVLEAPPIADAGTFDLGISPPSVVGDVMRGGPAHRAGIRRGDKIISVDGVEIGSWRELGDSIRDRAGEELRIAWEREGVAMEALVVPEEGEEPVGATGVRRVGMIGVMRPWGMRRVPAGEAFVAGFRTTTSYLGMIVMFFWNLVRGQVSADAVGGPIRIVQIASESARWGASYFLGFMAFFSLNLFLINLLPLPMLDGGHLLLLGLEKVRRRSLTERQLLVWQQVGLFFFIGLTVFLIVKDALLTP